MNLSVLQSAPIAALVADERERVVAVNRAFEQLCEIEGPSLVGRSLAEVLAPLADAPDPLAQIVAGDQPHSVTVRVLGLGPRAETRLRVALWRDRDAILALSEPVGAYEDVAASLSELASLIAHEIRNPLAGIGSALEVISDRLPHGGSEREVIAEIRGRLDRLNDQVNDLLLLFRPVQLQKSRCDLVKLIEAAQAESSGPVDLDGAPLTLFADPELLEKALRGILRYGSDPNLALTVSWVAADRKVVLQVSGGRLTAISGPAADYWSVRNPHDGLELPVALRIAEAHGGRLEADHSSAGVTLRLELSR